jgi:hypothetical protein
MIGYICLNERKIDLNHFRYEIGKIYKSKINCFDTLEDLLIYYHYQGSMRFFKVRFSEKNSTLLCNDVERIIKEFKIVKEIDYLKLINSDNYNIQLLSTEKNKEESMLEKFSSSDNPSALIAVINAGVDKYLNKLIKRNKSVSLILSKYKRKKDIETFINSKDLELVSIIASFGISKYLDYLSRRSKNGYEKYIVAAFGGRIKDVKEYLKMISKKNDFDNLSCELRYNVLEILRLGYDCVLDILINYDDFDEHVAKIGRKSDLDRIIKKRNDKFTLRKIASAGFDEHLDEILKNKKNIDDDETMRIINEIR